ncbi:MAG: S9 family peptidase [Actinobacteria bacterium]|nr:S9 family peptidase [Actinomycetota bacterium]
MTSLRDYLEVRTATPANFSPDGASVLVHSDLGGTVQLYRVPATGGALEPLTDFAEPVSGEYLEGGGGRILLTMDEGGNERLQLFLLDPDTRASEPLVHDPRFIHHPGGSTRDGTLLAYGCNRRNGTDFDVYVRRLADGEERCVFAPGGWAEPVGFSPDGRWLAVSRPSERSGDNDLFLLDVEGDEVLDVGPHDDEAELGTPAWLAGSRSFLFATSIGRDTVAVARFDLDGRAWRYVLEDGWDLECTTDRAGSRLLVTANADGYSRLELRDAETLALVREVPLPGRGLVTSAAFSPDGRRLVLGFTSPTVPGDAWIHDLDEGTSARLTESPSSVAQELLVEPELHRLESFDGEPVPLFAFLPPGAGEQAPVIVYVHGGPESQLRPRFLALLQYFVGEGFAVVAPNVRGSTGYGKRYEHLDDVERRLDSVRDLAALHDWLAADPRFDERRVVLYGGSYGGYMVLAGLAFHPERWAAGIDVVGISDLVTFLEHTADWRRPYREREYGSLEHHRHVLESASPISRVDAIRAPLFIIHGANDPRVPLGEAEQIHRELSARGVRCELLVYGDEGHGLKKLANRLDAYPQAVAFVHDVLAAPADRGAAG